MAAQAALRVQDGAEGRVGRAQDVVGRDAFGEARAALGDEVED